MSLISISETSATIRSGISVGSASTVISRVTCSSTPPSLTPGASSVPSSSIATSAWISSSSCTSWRSMCWRLPRTGWSCCSLTTTGTAEEPSISRSNRAWPPAITARISRSPHLEGARLGAAAVDDPGHEAVAPQAARAARAELRAWSGFQGFAIGGHRRERIEKPVARTGNLWDPWIRPMADESKIPKGRVRRSAKLGSVRRRPGRPLCRGPRRPTSPAPRRAAREARAAPHRDGDEDGRRARPDEGRGDEARPVRLLHRHRVHPRGVPRDLPGAAGEAAHRRPGDAVGEGREGARRGVRRRAARGAVRRVRAGGLRRRLDRAGPPRRAARRATGRGQDPVPGDRRGAGRRPPQRRDHGAAGPGARPRARRQGDRRTRSASG